MTDQNWRTIIQDRYETGLLRIKPLLPVIKKDVEQPKQAIVEPPKLNTSKEEKIDVIEVTKENIEPEVVSTKVINDDVGNVDEIDDQAAEIKSGSDIDDGDVDLANVVESVGSHSANDLKLGWVENKNKNRDDFHTIEWGRESNVSFIQGRVQYPVPMFWNSEGNKLHLEDSARGLSAILTSKTNNQYDKCHQITVNNDIYSQIKIITKIENVSAKTLKSSIIKIMPLEFARRTRQDGTFNFHNPFSCYFMRNGKYQHGNFWYEDCFFSEDRVGYGDLITSLRILFVMGYRTIYLDGFKSPSNDFVIYDDVIKNSIGKLAIFNIGNDDIRGVTKFDRSKAMELCIL